MKHAPVPPMFRNAFAALALIMVPSALYAQESMIPVPTMVIYPNTMIESDMLVDRAADGAAAAPAGSIVQDRSEVIGKVTRRTLLPGAPILTAALADPHAVMSGAEVKIIFDEGGVTITTTGSAMQTAGVGDLVRVRNSDTGLVISGIVELDGSVRVGTS